MSKKLVLFLIFVTIIIQVAEIFGFVFFVRHQLQEAIFMGVKQQQTLLARDYANSFETNITDVQRKIALISKYPSIQTGKDKTCSATLKEALPLFGMLIHALNRVDEKGIVVCSSEDARIGNDITTYSKDEKDFYTNHPKDFIVGSVARLPGNQAIYYVPIMFALWDKDGKFIGSINAKIDLEKLRNSGFSQIPFLPQSYIVITDQNGDFVFHPEQRYVGNSGFDVNLLKSPQNVANIRSMIEKSASGESGVIEYFRQSTQTRMIAAHTPLKVSKDRVWTLSLTSPFNIITSELEKNSSVGSIEIYYFFAAALIMITVTANTFLILFVTSRFKK